MAPPAATLRLFVYGTLKRGGRFHERFCRGALSIEPASVRGRLYTLPEGYPVLVVPRNAILAHGTADALADVALDRPVTSAGMSEGAGWQDIDGELQTFDDPRERLAVIDRLEDFHPGSASLYLRVLLPVRRNAVGETVTAWAYVEGRRRS